MATIQSVQEQPAAADAPGEADGPGAAAERGASAGGRDHGQAGAQPASADEGRAGGRGQFFGPAAAVTIIAALIASMTLAAVTAFNTLRSDILSVRTELRDEIASVESSLRTELREEIGSLRTELHEFRTEVGAVLLDHAERLARIEALLLNGAANPAQQS